MIKKHVYMKWSPIILIFISQTLVIGQNIVFNPGFEDTLSCPITDSEIYKAIGWSSYRGTPDYCNACCTPGTASVPNNWGGYQVAAQGDAYATIYSRYLAPSNYREYIGSQLIQPLIIGTKYYVSMKVSLANNTGNYATNKVGIMFSTMPYTVGNPTPITNNPPIYTQYIISDTTGWTLVSGSFIADSAYQYIILGNFFDDNNTDTLFMGGDSTYTAAYYYLDEICVSADSSSCELNIGIEENNSLVDFRIYPNPTRQNATLEFSNSTKDNCTLTLYNIYGRLVRTIANIISDKVEIDAPNLPSGLYFFRLQTTRKIIATGKLVIE